MAIIKCPKCGEKVSDKADICQICGVNFSDYLKCNKCGELYLKENDICNHCGEVNPTKKIDICQDCGHLVYEDEKCCSHCGCPNSEYRCIDDLYKCSECGVEYSTILECCPECGCPNDGLNEYLVKKEKETNRRKEISIKSLRLRKRKSNIFKSNGQENYQRRIDEEYDNIKKQFSNTYSKVNTSKIIKEAKEKVDGKRGTLLVSYYLKIALIAIGNLIPVVGSLILYGPLNVGYAKVYANCEAGEEVDEKDILRQLKEKFGPSFYAGIKQILYFAIPIVLCLTISYLLNSLIGTILKELMKYANVDYKVYSFFIGLNIFLTVIAILIIVIICAIRTSLIYYIVNANKDIDGDEATRISINLMKGREVEYMILQLKLILEYIKCIFFFYGVPVIEESKAIYFNLIYKEGNK